MAADLSEVIGKFTSGISKTAIINSVGWLVVGLIVIGLVFWFIWYYSEKKKYNKKIVAHSIIYGSYVPSYEDKAKSVRLGRGGFEILYLKKMKTWKLAHGARTGVNRYDFYIQNDGYWYPGQVSANILQIDKNGGFLPVLSTNPTMRSQYTSLEKQIDTLHGQKVSFWDKYGNWVMSIGFVLIMGVFAWLSFREVGKFLGAGTALADKMNELSTSLNKLAVNLCTNQQPGGLIPAP